MDASAFAVNTVRYDHLQRLLKQYEMLNSLGGPAATLAAAVDNDQQQQNNFLDLESKTASSVSTALANFMLQREQTMNETNNSVSRDRSTSFLHETFSLRQAIPLQPMPVLTPNDRTSSASEKLETVLEGEDIACFAVGGEKRLCLPQVLSAVLRNCSTMDINRARTDLSIHCSHCTQEQLNALKVAGVLTSTSTSCGLITKTDAERLCNYLLRQNEKNGAELKRGHHQRSSFADVHKARTCGGGCDDELQANLRLVSASSEGAVSVPVMHMCFGRCRGRYWPKLYASPSAECIECDECGELFAPDRFVMHSHRNQERRTCHWGFDSANWRAYIHSPDNRKESTESENEKILDQMKLRFDVTGLTKRRFNQDDTHPNGSDLDDDNQQLKKRIKLDAGDQLTTSLTDKFSCPLPTPVGLEQQQSLSYLLCDPLFLMAYYQTILSATSGANGRTPQLPLQLGVAPLPLPHPLVAPILSGGISRGIESNFADGLMTTTTSTETKTGYVTTLHPTPPQQLQTTNSEQLRSVNATELDEATAAAALKLLQLRATDNNDCFGNVVYPSAPPPPLLQDVGRVGDGGAKMETAGSVSVSTQKGTSPNHSWTSSSKEPFKKQLLHLFVVEQQQKQQFLELQQQQQQQQQRSCSQQQQDSGRASVEVIVDGDDDEEYQTQKRKMSEAERCCDLTGGRVSTETQVADESSASSSDTEGVNGETSLDDLLRRYVDDDDGLRLVRTKIAANQRYLEQKLDAVASENRLLREECLQLKAKHYQVFHQQQQHLQQHQHQHQQHHSALSFASLMSKSVK